LKVEQFINDPDIKDFYMNRLGDVLKNYSYGVPEGKPEVLKQIEELKRTRESELERMKNNEGMQRVTIKIGDDPPKTLSIKEIVQILQQQHEHINHLTSLLQGKDMEIEMLNDALLHL
jgi:hypothetical protein